LTAIAAEETNVIAFEETLAAMRARTTASGRRYHQDRFRPVGGKVADFACPARRKYHFFYSSASPGARRFYPGHEIYFGHASTADFVQWQVHDSVMLIRPGTWRKPRLGAVHPASEAIT